ncbi:choice-of-anchor D domain-containing protein [Paucibacter sp. R3-3]|uniref:Choice-of-anchor D domain-containing protein n=1 Tax=Roseateles agri TaxID=3098619 RepID=A0ABU5DCD5_9BURK|nr:choice-of-anchor D domain-containing protein [Paucibacter sp. R3-3]MDY0743358.1 choice-of-anchor D domain-containing protein [Paucibacter sp. R3-3]
MLSDYAFGLRCQFELPSIRQWAENAVRRLAASVIFLLPPALMTPGPLHAQIAIEPNGTPSYTKAIAVPPGVAGMAPALSLAYTAGSTNGPLGFGWTLQGVSVIARCPSTIAVDGIAGGVTFGVNDKLCLDGQRLIQTDSTGTPLPFPQVGDASGLIDGAYIEYRTEKDNFARIRAYGSGFGARLGAASGPAFFRVWTKAGQIYDYGNSPGTDQANNGLIGASRTGLSVRVWAVSRISDNFGNHIDFKYAQNLVPWGSGATSPSAPTSGLEWNLTEVDYGVNKVSFAYGPRAPATPGRPLDASETIHANFKTVSTQLLQSISTYVGSSPATTIKISYSVGPASGRSRIASLQDCAGDVSSNRCLPPTTFEYANQASDAYQAHAGFASSGLVTEATTGTYYGVLTGDFDGDGRTDILRWSGYATENELWFSRTVGGVDTFVKSANGTGANLFNLSNISLFRSNGCYTSIAADFNGDGRTDILNIATGVSIDASICPVGGTNKIFLSNGDGSFGVVTVPSTINFAQNLSVQVVASGNLGVSQSQGNNFYLIDVNGDGILDIVTTILPAYPISNPKPTVAALCATQVCTHVYLGQADGSFVEAVGTNLAHQSVYSAPTVTTNYLLRVANTGDWNGDGLVDLLVDSGTWLSNGDGNFTLSATSIVGGCTNPIDFNGDGHTDCLNTTTAGSSLAVGGSHESAGNFNLNGSILVSANAANQQTSGVIAIDVNGDGRQDILYWSDAPAGNALWISNGDGTFSQSTTFNLGGATAVQLQNAARNTVFIAGDFTGHGAVELLRLQLNTNNGVPNNQLFTKLDATPIDQLVSVTSAAGSKTRLYYVPLANSIPAAGVPSQALGARYVGDRNDVHQRAIYPTVDVTAPLYVVSTMVTDTGIGSTTVNNEFAYRGLKSDAWGRGSLGFREVLRQSVAADGSLITGDTQTLQAHPYTGLTAASAVYLGALNSIDSRTPVRTTSSIYCDLSTITGADSSTDAAAENATSAAPCPVAAKVQRPFLVSKTESGNDVLGSGLSLPSVVTKNVNDSSGNPKSVTVTIAGSVAGVTQTFQTLRNTVYQQDDTTCVDYLTCNWILGRLIQETVNKSVPNSLPSISTTAGSATLANATAGAGPTQVAMLPSTFGFDGTVVGETSVRAIVLSNMGGFPVTIAVPTGSNVTGADFGFSSTTCGSRLAVGASCAITVWFKPTTSGPRSGGLSVNTGAGVLTSSLNGVGLQAKLRFSTETLAWGNQSVNKTYTSAAVTLTNVGDTGASNLLLSSLSLPFRLATNTCPTSLAVGSSCTVAVDWLPTAAQAYSATLSVSSSGQALNAIAISGTGTQGNVGLSAAQLSFGNQTEGHPSSVKSVVLTNTGTQALSVSGVNISSGSGDFSLSHNCIDVPVNGTCSVDIIFTPSMTGARTGAVTITHDGTGAKTITVDGVGVAMPTLNSVALIPSTITVGGTAQLTWVAGGGATSSSASCANAIGGSGVASPMTVTATVAGSGSCTVSASNAAGTVVTSQVNATVVPVPVVSNVSFATGTPDTSSPVTLRWTPGSGVVAVTVACTGPGYLSGAGAGLTGSSIAINTSAAPGSATCSVTPYNAAGAQGSTVSASFTSAQGTFAYANSSHNNFGNGGDVVTFTIRNAGGGNLLNVAVASCVGQSFHPYGVGPSTIAAGATAQYYCQANAAGSTGPVTLTMSGTNASNSTYTVSDVAPSVTSVGFSPATITTNDTATFSWTASAALSTSASCSGAITGSGTGSATGGSIPVMAGSSVGGGTCTVSVSGNNGSATRQGAVDVVAAPSVTGATFAPNTVIAGSSSVFSWTTSNATSASVACDAPVSGVASGTSGSVTVTPSAASTAHCTVTAANAAGRTATGSGALTVNAPPPSGMTASFSPSTVTTNGSATFSWSATNATSTSASCTGAVSGSATGAAGGGSVLVTAGSSAGTGTCTATFSGPGGTTSYQSSIAVVLPPTVTSAGFSPIAVTTGGSSSFSWNTSNASSASVSCAGAASGSGSGTSGTITASTSGAGTGTCTVTAQNAAGATATGGASLTVNPGMGVLTEYQGVIHTSNGNSNDFATFYLKNTGTGTISNLSWSCSGASFRNTGTTTLSSLAPGATFAAQCWAAYSGGYNAAKLTVSGTNMTTVTFGPQ